MGLMTGYSIDGDGKIVDIPLMVDELGRLVLSDKGMPFSDSLNGVGVFEQGRFTHDFVPASTTRILGGGGAVGDYLRRLIIFPASANPGVITLADGDGAARTVLPASAALVDLKPIVIEFDAICTNPSVPGWKIVTLLNASVWAIGRFTS